MSGLGADGLRPRSKVWLERDGEVVLSEWRVELLEAVAATGSLAAAAARVGVPYRTAWTRLREIEAGLGFKVLDTQSGGAEGGGSRLTPEAQRMLDRFHRVADGVGKLVDERFAAAFGADEPPGGPSGVTPSPWPSPRGRGDEIRRG